jgi:hypothetical protein
MPYDEVMRKWKAGTLKSGSGGRVVSRKQAIAIMLSEKRKAEGGNREYMPRRKGRFLKMARKMA